MEVEACYNYGFLPAERGRQQQQQPPPPPPYGHGPPPPPHPAAEDGELWEYFPCPFCYIEVEVPFICNHLQEEHCFDTRNAVCPICANNLGRDMAAHFRVEHSHLLKRRKPSKPSCAWPEAATNSASYFDERERMGMGIGRPYQPDPLLSQFITCSVEQTHHAENDQRCTSKAAASDDEASSKLGLQERLQRIDFLTEILMSTIL